jgi:hypothetical protein
MIYFLLWKRKNSIELKIKIDLYLFLFPKVKCIKYRNHKKNEGKKIKNV